MVSVKLDDLTVKNLKARETEYTLREKGGFGVRVLPSGRKTFFYIYRVDGLRRFLNLGTYKDKTHPEGITLASARREYEAERARVLALKEGRNGGADPLVERRQKKNERVAHREASTISSLCEEYLERHAKKFKRSWAKDEQILNRDIIPLWGEMKAAEITKRDVIHLLEKIVDRGAPAMANNTFQIIRKMFNYAVEKDILLLSPCMGVKLPSPKNHRERVLSEEEIKTLWTSLDRIDLNMSDEIRRALRLILVTAQRPGEVAGMHSSEIDGHWWTIPAERAKNGKAHRVYLSDLAIDLIGPLEVMDHKTGEMKARGYIFRTPVREKDQPIGDTALPVAVRRNLAIPLTDKNGNPLFTKEGKPATENRLGIEHFVPHDLRRTAATFMAKAGEMDEVIDAVLNHAKAGIIKVYNQYRYDKEKQIALEGWGRKLKSIITGEKGNVIPLRKAGGE
jgi:integrase